ncbi:HdeD family acid-resistance protein [Paraburkholderia caballeronis]|uniref:Uncharacterized membrane protein HdeD, DUF308 family n=1 Tax=Paraburkholderia caballeronis TaxID=416943 RepID=A0A1H7FUU3_9BURK|nr:DUF308 domain-containing protein [Paraburkholderia caballeronis]PXW24831.1 uncharacterized membrane protein HdeD (DUF308 family) [Paraburkholderia caballeronis]PXX00561.1 uncharacterized membrane protein HdeD (DUF308 family) [Paraburkholderia caballeronis]RAJ98624.1 uncharacterized membrane protein HdeD (DUF308 family) [Paraburkholderia caballeronis]SEE68434.1 Uncharacterized membrane protein HdeD, DUF308 family [Paraburkholderia caballeronis]SEK29719.1 Uncharacterized membrane protein HdeD
MIEPGRNPPPMNSGSTKRSVWPLSTSAILVVAGIFCILIPFVSPIAGPLFIGRILIFCGFAHLLRLFATRGARNIVRRIPPVVVPVLIGILVLVNEGPHARSLAVLLMIFFVLDGFFKMVSSIESDPARIDNLSLVSAGLSLFLAVFLAATFPGTPTWMLSLFLGLDLISMGIVTASKGTRVGA